MKKVAKIRFEGAGGGMDVNSWGGDWGYSFTGENPAKNIPFSWKEVIRASDKNYANRIHAQFSEAGKSDICICLNCEIKGKN